MLKIAFSQLYVYIGRESLAIKYVTVSVSSFHLRLFIHALHATLPTPTATATDS